MILIVLENRVNVPFEGWRTTQEKTLTSGFQPSGIKYNRSINFRKPPKGKAVWNWEVGILSKRAFAVMDFFVFHL